ncbi:MAG: Protein phosphatase [Chloroflexi bacterium]|nr:Protein phosphatase [Chloroflexota bacterium]
MGLLVGLQVLVLLACLCTLMSVQRLPRAGPSTPALNISPNGNRLIDPQLYVHWLRVAGRIVRALGRRVGARLNKRKARPAVYSGLDEAVVNDSAAVGVPPSLSEPPHARSLHSGFTVCMSRGSRFKETRGGVNQDASTAGGNEKIRYMAVADGVGGGDHSEVASLAIIKSFEDFANGLQDLSADAVKKAVTSFYDGASDDIQEALTAAVLAEAKATTTFIGVIESHDCYVMTHLADGSIFVVVQSEDGESMGANSFLLAGEKLADGPPQIGAAGKSGTAEVISLAKQRSEGYLWIIATDGMRDLHRFRFEDNNRGIQAASELAEELWQVFSSAPESFGEDAIWKVLRKWMDFCQGDDDASIAVLIDGEMIAHWNDLKSKEREEYRVGSDAN